MLQEFRGLGRQDVEGVGDQQLRLLQLVEQAGDEVGQAGGIDVAKGFFLVLPCPFGKCGVIFIPSRCADPPLVEEPPGVAAMQCRRFGKQQVLPFTGRSDHFLPQQLLLRRREEKRELVAELGVERVFPQPLDEGAEGQDVGRFPDRQPLPDLKGVEFGGQGLGKAPVGRDHRDARGVAFRQPLEQLHDFVAS